MFIAGLLAGPGTASAQTAQERLDAISAQMKHLRDFSAKLPPGAREKLSAGTQHMLRMADMWDKLAPQMAQAAAIHGNALNGKPFSPRGSLPPGEVSDPSTDVAFSRISGSIQSETSTAWCGQNVVVAFNDSGSFWETLPLTGIGISENGYSRSTDRGRTFTDLGFLDPGPNFFGMLEGDPVVACTDENTFYQSSGFTPDGINFGASVSKSTDGGQTFGDPVAVVLKNVFDHFIDKPWMAVDPSNPNILYVTYTDVDSSLVICPFRLGIELVRSTDGGATWSSPTIVDNGCDPADDQGSSVAVDAKGNVFVAWEQFQASVPTADTEIIVAKSSDHGATFGPKVTVATVKPVGHVAFQILQGGFRGNQFPSLAIDTSRGSRRGTVYIAWNDGKNGIAPDGFPPFGGATYDFADALISRSDNGGASWSAPVKMNDDIGAAAGIDHFLPGINVNAEGTIGACWYDRRRDPLNFLIDRECATSSDGAKTWRNTLITRRSFSPVINDDILISSDYMGDYDGVTSDILAKHDGFLGAYDNNSLGNQDARISRRFGGADDSGDQDDN
jgi:hypothetical protein